MWVYNMSLDAYKVLGVAKDAKPEAIKAAYRKLARKYHPDVNPGDTAAEDKFKEISEAYDILSDPVKKAEYDNLGREDFYKKGFGGTGYQRPDFSRGGFSFDDIFGDLFGNTTQSRSGQRANFGFGSTPARKGSDYNYKITISLREAATGVEVPLDLKLPQTCPQCQGQGIMASGGGVRSCPSCQGQGHTLKKESLKAKIPAAIESGQKVRLRGKGAAGTNGGPAGDLLLEVEVRPDAVFSRQGQNLYADCPVSLYDALLGATIEVATLFGRANLKLPEGLANGAKMRLKGQGLPATKNKDAGDLYITLTVVLPAKLTEEAKGHLAEIAKLAPISIP